MYNTSKLLEELNKFGAVTLEDWTESLQGYNEPTERAIKALCNSYNINDTDISDVEIAGLLGVLEGAQDRRPTRPETRRKERKGKRPEQKPPTRKE